MRAKDTFPPFEKVGGAYLDHENKRFVIITKDVLLNQLQRDCPKIATSFDELLKDDLEAMSEMIASISTIILPHILGRDLSDESRSATCARLLNTAMTTLIGCVHLARGGFRLQYATLSRSVIETICTVLYLMVSENALRDFHSGKLKSTRAISAAKAVIPIFGKMWGLLSNQFVHITTLHSTLEPLTHYTSDDEALSFVRPNMKTLTWLLSVATELTFIQFIEHPKYWEVVRKVEGGSEINFSASDEIWEWVSAFIEMKVDR